ncbi:MAG: hypothetical protein HZA66_15885 [Rhodopseudomonas palustris]|uniref:Uncharacterized protein n=1 Tax=Rhodopseudomonas palustris TaxID=1076 RepID=A0A933RZ60_RHOPL|nr:hypothetical protein [Rhodopseudomonas palustris]
MTDASALPRSSAATSPVPGSATRRAIGLLVAAAFVSVASLATSPEASSLAAAQSDAELVMLLRFMAGVKALLALFALGVSVWRLGHPAPLPLTLAYIVAPALMCAAPAVIWQLAHVAAGAALFHGGLVVLLLALYADRGQGTELAKSAALRLRRASFSRHRRASRAALR